MQAASLGCALAGSNSPAGSHTDTFSFSACPSSIDGRLSCAKQNGFIGRHCKADFSSTNPKEVQDACLPRQKTAGNRRRGIGKMQSAAVAQQSQAAGGQSWPPFPRSGGDLKGSWGSAQDHYKEGCDVAHTAAQQQIQLPGYQHAGQLMHEVRGVAGHCCEPSVFQPWDLVKRRVGMRQILLQSYLIRTVGMMLATAVAFLIRDGLADGPIGHVMNM